MLQNELFSKCVGIVKKDRQLLMCSFDVVVLEKGVIKVLFFLI